MRINIRLLVINLIKLILTIFIFQALSMGVYHVYNYYFDDYVAEAKVVSSCFDSADSCEIISDVSNIKNLEDYVKKNEIIEAAISNIENSKGVYLSVTDVKESITVRSKNGYILLQVKNDDSYYANQIYANIMDTIFEKVNTNETRYMVADYSLHEVISLSTARLIGLYTSIFIAFFTIFSVKNKNATSYLLGGITLSKNKMKQNIIITLITITIFAVVGTGIYYGHKTLLQSYEIETKYTFVCNDPNTCDFDNIRELSIALKSFTSKNSTVTSIIDSVSNKSQIHLSTEDVEKSFDIELRNDVIVLVVNNKNTLTATYINDTIINTIFKEIELQEDIKLRQLDSDFSETPRFNTYLLSSITLGSVVALLLISSDFTFKTTKKSSTKASK